MTARQTNGKYYGARAVEGCRDWRRPTIKTKTQNIMTERVKNDRNPLDVPVPVIDFGASSFDVKCVGGCWKVATITWIPRTVWEGLEFESRDMAERWCKKALATREMPEIRG